MKSKRMFEINPRHPMIVELNSRVMEKPEGDESLTDMITSLYMSAVVSAGYSPGLGFIHHGKQLAFVYDVADLYKTLLTVPLAFWGASGASESPGGACSAGRQQPADVPRGGGCAAFGPAP